MQRCVEVIVIAHASPRAPGSRPRFCTRSWAHTTGLPRLWRGVRPRAQRVETLERAHADDKARRRHDVHGTAYSLLQPPGLPVDGDPRRQRAV